MPTPAQEAVRDLWRTRDDMVEDLTRARNRLSGFLLRHSMVWRGGSTWTQRHERWLAGLHFEDRALASTFAHYLATVRRRDAALAPLPSAGGAQERALGGGRRRGRELAGFLWAEMVAED